MKRSEAIKKIANLLYEKCDFDCPNEMGAKVILDFIEEELKMKPPRNSKEYCYYVHEHPCDYIDDLLEWDNEE